MKQFIVLSIICCGLIETSVQAHAKQPVEVKLEVGVGPAYQRFFGTEPDPYGDLYGAHIHLTSVIDQDVVRRYKKKIPKRFRKQVLKSKEVKYRPGILAAIPKTLIITPGVERSAYGAIWDLMGLSVTLGPLGVGANVQAAYLYLSHQKQGSNEKEVTHFLRPALGLSAFIPVQLTDSFGLTLGWVSSLTIPQEIGGSPLEASTSTDGTLWHLGQAYLSFNFRFPYEVNL